jgi:hypothetical protein
MKRLIYILSACFGLLLTHSANAQTAAADNKVSESITFNGVPKGPGVYGIFEGRTPCTGVVRQFGSEMPSGCDHLKWRIIFFRDTVTGKPTTYIMTTEMFGRRPVKGKWRIARGTRADPAAIVFALDYGPGKSFYLEKGDENVLFILDENLEYRTGDPDFSYTLNRVHPVRRLPRQ